MSSFTKSQSEAIRHVDGPLLVLAGPGSGKTTVVTKRVQYLVQDCSISPSSILVITFTKAAATEMKGRFTRLMEQQAQPPGGYGNVSFGTFHAVFFNILKLSYGFTVANIITEETRRQYLKESVDRMKLEIDDENEFLTGIAGEISLIKNERVELEHYFSKNCSEEVFRKIYEGYEERKKRARLIDFDDMLVYTWELLSQRKDILPGRKNISTYWWMNFRISTACSMIFCVCWQSRRTICSLWEMMINPSTDFGVPDRRSC